MRTKFPALMPLILMMAACFESSEAPRSCVVDGRSYPSGTTGIEGPGGCPACECDDGKLACDDVGCGPEAPAPCSLGGKTYESGTTGIPAADGCNTCACDDGVLACTEEGCAGNTHCVLGGVSYASGESVPTDCGACTCENGEISCLAIECPAPCLVDGKEVPSGELVSEDPDGCNSCSCEDGDVVCTDQPCVPREVACVVNGVEYPSGTGGIKDPFSCNECTCYDGELACTDIACPEECPPNRVPGTSCARCGIGDGCEAVETGCFVVCGEGADAACDEPGHSICVDNACRNLCG